MLDTVFHEPFYLRLQGWNICFYGQPHLFGSDSIVAVDQNMPHTFNDIPFNFRMFRPERFGKHVHSFADDFYMLDETKENDGILLGFFKAVLVFIVKQNIDGRKDMFQSSSILNPFSHKSKSCRGWPNRWQRGAVCPVLRGRHPVQAASSSGP